MDSAEPEYVERYLRELAGALDTFTAAAGVDVIARGHADPLGRAVTALYLDAFERGLRQGGGECAGTVRVVFMGTARAVGHTGTAPLQRAR